MKLKNISNRMAVVTLPHVEVCSDRCYCTGSTHLQSVHNPKTGDVGIREVNVLVPVSLHIPAGMTTEELPDSFMAAQVVRTNPALRKVD
jgi:hypothetical protein